MNLARSVAMILACLLNTDNKNQLCDYKPPISQPSYLRFWHCNTGIATLGSCLNMFMGPALLTVYQISGRTVRNIQYTTFLSSSCTFYHSTSANCSTSHNICPSAVYFRFEDLKNFSVCFYECCWHSCALRIIMGN